MTGNTNFAAPSNFCILYAGAQSSRYLRWAECIFLDILNRNCFVFCNRSNYTYSVRLLPASGYFAASIAGAIIGVVLFCLHTLLLFFRFEFSRDLSI